MKQRGLIAVGTFAILGFAVAVAAAQGEVRVIREATADQARGLYLPNRTPLRPTAFTKLPVGCIKPKGWLRRQLELDAAGLSGRLPEISHFLKYPDNGWVDPRKGGWEELTYWLRGYGDLAYVLKDEKMIKEARKWVDGILASQQSDGYFGPLQLKPQANKGNLPDAWAHMPALDALVSHYDFTGDERVPKFMANYFQWLNKQPAKYFRTGWAAMRWADHLRNVFWLYNRTGDPSLLELSRRIHESSPDYVARIPTWHNVNLAQGIREPAEYWLQSGDPKHIKAIEANYDRIIQLYGQFPGGGFAGDENCRPGYGDPRQGFETCGIVEFMQTFEMMTRISGNPLWADRCEELAFNSLPAALTLDHKGIHYITCANCVQLDRGVKGDQFQNKFAMLQFEPGVDKYRCCTHNYGMGWPYYAEELWLATADCGLCASLYADCEVKAKVGDGTVITVVEETNYPFSDVVKLRVSTPRALRFPLYLRIPRWCDAPTLTVNGQAVESKAGPLSFLVVERQWQDGDSVLLHLPMRIAVRTWIRNKNSVSVDYGPLTFSLAIKEKWVRSGGSDVWPAFEVFADSPWNYGLVLDEKDPPRSFEIVRKPGFIATNPFTHADAPLSLRVKARKIPAWQSDQGGVVGVLQQSPARSDEPVETVTLIPMGAARLRITSFPTIGDSHDARQWTPPAVWPKASASHVNASDTVTALHDEVEPTRSSDENIPRFTWWDHKGTTEWIQYDFAKPVTIARVSVYWFDDTGHGHCRVPESWRLLYKDGETWNAANGVKHYGTDSYNSVTFTPVRQVSRQQDCNE